jgi:hypothetical protein
MKLKLFYSVFALVFLFSACSKDLSFMNEDGAGSNSLDPATLVKSSIGGVSVGDCGCGESVFMRVENKNGILLGSQAPGFVIFGDGQIPDYPNQIAIWVPAGSPLTWVDIKAAVAGQDLPGWWNGITKVDFYYGVDFHYTNHDYGVVQRENGWYATKTKNGVIVDFISNTIWFGCFCETPQEIEVEVNATMNFAESYNKIFHKPVYATASGTLVSKVNINAGRAITVDNVPKNGIPSIAYDLAPGIIGSYYARYGGNANNSFNGFTYLEINTATLAATAGGVNIGIGVSNMSNGSLPNAGWNSGLGFDASYNISIVNGELIVTINDCRTASWDAVLFKMDSKRSNNPNSDTKHAIRESKNLGKVSGTIFLFWHGQSITTNEITGCTLDRKEGPFFNEITADYEIVVTCEEASAITGRTLRFNEEGIFTVTVELKIDGEVIKTEVVTVAVEKENGRLKIATPPVTVDFGQIVLGAAPDIIICAVCQ